ncbi:MAG: hypothetical protein C5B55_01115, partial [Blastocatellia bacterium]
MYFTREVQLEPEEVTTTHDASASGAAKDAGEEHVPAILQRALDSASADFANHGPRKLFRSPALSVSPNSGIRVIALSRAQHTHGNRYTQRLVSQIQLSSNRGHTIQRECACGGTCAKCSTSSESTSVLTSLSESLRLVQAQQSASAAIAPSGPGDHDLIPTGGGEPLDETTRRDMEQRFGADFRDVRIHNDAAAAASAAALGANAYTTGRDIYFAAGNYAPESQEGQHLLAHELTHVEQQRAGQAPTQSESTANGEVLIGAADDHLEKQAEAQADNVTQGQQATTSITADSSGTTSSVAPDSSGVIQRDGVLDNPIVNKVTSGLGQGADFVVGGVKKGKDLVVAGVKKGAQWAIGQIEKLAPGAIAFFKNIKDYFKNAISNGIDNFFGGILSSIREKGLAATLAEMVGSFASGAIHAIGGFIAGKCAAIGQLAEYLIDVVTKFGSGVLDSIKKGFNTIATKLEELWNEYGAPALDWVKKKLKGIWKDVEETASAIWKALKPLRDEIAEIWNAVTDFLAEGKRTYDSWMQSFVNDALDKWEEIKAKLKPYMGYVKTGAKVAGAIVVLLSPAGPFVVLGLVIYGLYLGVKYLWEKYGKPFTKPIREWWVNDGLPTAQNKLKEFRTKVDDVKDKVIGGLQKVYDVFMQILDALGILTFLAIVKGIFDSVTKKIKEFKEKLDKQLEEWGKKIKDLLAKA